MQRQEPRRQRLGITSLLVIGLLCLGMSQVPIVRTWGLYVLPLNYLSWIGLGLMVLAALLRLKNAAGAGPYRYVQDGVPVVEHGNTPGSREITINAPRGAMLGFITVEPIPSVGSTVTYYDGQLYWPSRVSSGVWPDVARDNWHRAERAITDCGKAKDA